ncbi:MAG: roadblock/LC7 domain-containing protein [Planctomycetes bacterium]|nr:roadblock/LC7 domain-containing protein [Planctomycetota bacterium]
MMERILATLNRAVGVKGSLIVHRDGIVVKSLLGPDMDTESVSALAAATIHATRRSLARMGLSAFSRLVLTATHGKMIFVDVDPTYLVVVTRRDINLDLTLLEIEGAAYKLRNLGRILTG